MFTVKAWRWKDNTVSQTCDEWDGVKPHPYPEVKDNGLFIFWQGDTMVTLNPRTYYRIEVS